MFVGESASLESSGTVTSGCVVVDESIKGWTIEADGKTYTSMDEMFDDWEKNKNVISKFIDKKFPKGSFGYRISYIITHPWVLLKEYYSEVKWAWQRVFRQYDSRIIWSIDYYLAKMLPIWLRELQERKQGVPMMMFEKEDFNKDGDIKDEYTEELRSKQYNEILEKIAVGFENYMKYQDGNSLLEKDMDETFQLLSKYFSTLWD
jgi:hypothetical protein